LRTGQFNDEFRRLEAVKNLIYSPIRRTSGLVLAQCS
jgi:hypothetical protein